MVRGSTCRRNVASVYISSFDCGWYFELDESLSDDSEVETNVKAGHTVTILNTLPESVGCGPDNVVDRVIVEPLKESFFGNIVNCVREISNTGSCVGPNVKLTCKSRCLTSSIDVTEGNHGSLCTEEGSDDTTRGEYGDGRSSNGLEVISESFHGICAVRNGPGISESISNTCQDIGCIISGSFEENLICR